MQSSEFYMMWQLLFLTGFTPFAVDGSDSDFLCKEQNGLCETLCSPGMREIGRWPLCFDVGKGCCIEETATATYVIDKGCSKKGGSCQTYCSEHGIHGDLCALGVCCISFSEASLPCSALGAECQPQCGPNQVHITKNGFCSNGICCANTVTTPNIATATSTLITNVAKTATDSTTTMPTKDITTKKEITYEPTTPKTSGTAQTVTQSPANVLDPKCGMDALGGKVKTRIINGVPAVACGFPSTVSILAESETLGVSVRFCSGVLIDSTTILSTADCVFAISESIKLHIFSASVVIRESDPDISEPNVTKIRIADFIIHDQYISKTRENNIGIIKLNESVAYNPCALPACVGNGDAVFPDVTTCQVVGFGSTVNDQEASDGNLTVGDISVYSSSICRTFSNLVRKDLAPNTVCSVAESESDADPCNGDDGGVLVCPDITGKMMLRGLIMDYTCGEGGEPSTYLDVTKYEAWIRPHMSK